MNSSESDQHQEEAAANLMVSGGGGRRSNKHRHTWTESMNSSESDQLQQASENVVVRGGGGRRSNKRKHFTIWTENVERTMIKFFKNRPYLWHPKADGYFQKNKKEAAYLQLAGHLGHQYSASTIRDRWSSMRSSFLANDKKVESSPRDPRTGNPMYVPSWPFYDDLLFLRESRHARSKLSDSYGYEEDPFSGSTDDLTDIPAEDEHDWITRQRLADEVAIAAPPDRDDDCNSNSHPELPVICDPPRHEYQPQQQNHFSHLQWQVALKNIKAKNKGQDACDSFGTVVAASLRDMDSLSRARAQLDIQKVLLNYNPENPEGFNSALTPSASYKH